jgi:hypothetical protein
MITCLWSRLSPWISSATLPGLQDPIDVIAFGFEFPLGDRHLRHTRRATAMSGDDQVPGDGEQPPAGSLDVKL